MSLALSNAEKATITVDLVEGGTITPLGDQFHFSFDQPFASIEAQGGVLFVIGQVAGDCILHLTTIDGAVATDVPVSVSEAGGAAHLVVTFGTPEPK